MMRLTAVLMAEIRVSNNKAACSAASCALRSNRCFSPV